MKKTFLLAFALLALVLVAPQTKAGIEKTCGDVESETTRICGGSWINTAHRVVNDANSKVTIVEGKATINWLTTQKSNTRVIWGKYSVIVGTDTAGRLSGNVSHSDTFGYENSTVETDQGYIGGVTYHTALLPELESGVYYYRTVSRGGAGGFTTAFSPQRVLIIQ